MGGVTKQFRRLRGIPVFIRALLPFQGADYVRAITLVVAEEKLDAAAELVEEFGCDKVVRIVKGGEERSQSVQSGLSALDDIPHDVVVIHDGARPLVKEDLIKDVVMAAHEHGAAIPVLPISETVKLVGEHAVVRSVDRTRLRTAQTPQAFLPSWLREAYQHHGAMKATDDAWLVESCGFPVQIVKGRKDNIKLTHADDWAVVDKLLGGQECQRVGMGYDVHRLTETRPLVLGGIEVPSDLGLKGHSDADVLIHAIIDGMLGAAALPDIGQQFPDSDPSYHGIDSCVLLERTSHLLLESGWRVSNIDCTLAAQAPKLAPFIPEMKVKLASVLQVQDDQIGIKATTTEGLGFPGRREGICAWSVVMIRSVE